MKVTSQTFARAIVGLLLMMVIHVGAADVAASEPPVADAGSSRYAAIDPVQLDGTGSHDPDQAGPLKYAWRQASGPPVSVRDENTAVPTITGFDQTDEIQECVFELTTTDADMESSSALTSVFVVPKFGGNSTRLFNDEFDPDKPTIVYFGGGDCIIGSTDLEYGPRLPFGSEGWLRRANIIWLPYGYSPDDGPGRTYYRYADMLIVYLSRVAPDYTQLIQTSGWSTGGQPAIDVGIRLNQTYRDPRYAVNRVTFLDATPYCRDYRESIQRYLSGPVDGESCWVDNYVASIWEDHPLDPQPSFPFFHENVLNVEFNGFDRYGVPWITRHFLGNDWIGDSLDGLGAVLFNGGVTAGAFVSVAGPGKNLQLGSTPGQQAYHFRWREGRLEMVDGQASPGQLPAPVMLVTRTAADDATSDGVPSIVLSCHKSVNAIGYELMMGTGPYHVAHYAVASDSPTPPDVALSVLPYDVTWWTVRARDAFGSTIYAAPRRLDDFVMSLPIENATTGARYAYLQDAIDQASAGDEIVLDQGTYHENIRLTGVSLTIRCDDAALAEAAVDTIIQGNRESPVVTLSSNNEEVTVLKGLTITGGNVAISCQGADVRLEQCTIAGHSGRVAVEIWYGSDLETIDSTVEGEVTSGYDPTIVAHWRLDETEGATASDSAGDFDGTVYGDPVWAASQGRVDGALQLDGNDRVSAPLDLNLVEGVFSVFAWMKGGAPGQALVSKEAGVNWLAADASEGRLMTNLAPPPSRSGPSAPLVCEAVLTDGQWHHIGFVWDGTQRILYFDELPVAKDTVSGLQGDFPDRNLLIGCGADKARSTFWTGLIDDVRIYSRPVSP